MVTGQARVMNLLWLRGKKSTKYTSIMGFKFYIKLFTCFLYSVIKMLFHMIIWYKVDQYLQGQCFFVAKVKSLFFSITSLFIYIINEKQNLSFLIVLRLCHFFQLFWGCTIFLQFCYFDVFILAKPFSVQNLCKYWFVLLCIKPLFTMAQYFSKSGMPDDYDQQW